MSRFSHIAPDGASKGAQDSAQTGSQTGSQTSDAFDATHFLTQADAALNHGAFEKALRLYGRALERDRERPEAWLGQVRALLDMGQPEEATSWLEQAAGVLGEIPALLALRAIAAARSGNIDDARAWSDRALRDGRDAAEVWLARAEVVYATGGEKMARVNLGKAHERAPDADTARRCGEVALTAGDLTGALPWLRRAVRDAPESPLAALRMGVYWERAGDLEQARTELSRAVALSPHMESATIALDDLDNRGALSRLKSAFKRWNKG